MLLIKVIKPDLGFSLKGPEKDGCQFTSERVTAVNIPSSHIKYYRYGVAITSVAGYSMFFSFSPPGLQVFGPSGIWLCV